MFKFLLLVFALLAYSSAQNDFYRIGPIVEDDEIIQFELTKRISKNHPVADQLPHLHVRIDNLNDYRARIRVENVFSSLNAFSGAKRFVAPVQLDLDEKSKPDVASRLYGVNVVSSHQQSLVQVKRRSTGKIIFSIDLGSMIYSENFIQVQTTLSSSKVYGKFCFLKAFLFM